MRYCSVRCMDDLETPKRLCVQ
ncbi:hypothetical protein HU200_023607 [Digitaria exilis]|uniref:Uncharacterized protein n=1 Tax=Digitaria exilis TaxID=1010633 RepID=A0A835EXH5_9POAL|nr:hypothetical protein HU200_023607 [Digitaria exilis]